MQTIHVSQDMCKDRHDAKAGSVCFNTQKRVCFNIPLLEKPEVYSDRAVYTVICASVYLFLVLITKSYKIAE